MTIKGNSYGMKFVGTVETPYGSLTAEKFGELILTAPPITPIFSSNVLNCRMIGFVGREM